MGCPTGAELRQTERRGVSSFLFHPLCPPCYLQQQVMSPPPLLPLQHFNNREKRGLVYSSTSPHAPPSSLFFFVSPCLLQPEAYSLVVHEEGFYFSSPPPPLNGHKGRRGQEGGHSVIDCRDLRPAPGSGADCPGARRPFRSLGGAPLIHICGCSLSLVRGNSAGISQATGECSTVHVCVCVGAVKGSLTSWTAARGEK